MGRHWNRNDTGDYKICSLVSLGQFPWLLLELIEIQNMLVKKCTSTLWCTKTIILTVWNHQIFQTQFLAPKPIDLVVYWATMGNSLHWKMSRMVLVKVNSCSRHKVNWKIYIEQLKMEEKKSMPHYICRKSPREFVWSGLGTNSKSFKVDMVRKQMFLGVLECTLR